MKKKIVWLMISLFLSNDLYPLGRAYAQEMGGGAEKTYIAALDVEIKEGVPFSDKSLLSDRLREELFNTGKYKVLDRKNMDAILKEQGFQLAECTTTECAVEVGRLIGVEKIVIGNVRRLGETYNISVTIINVVAGEVEVIADDLCYGEIDQFLDAIRRVSRKLAGLSPEVPPPAETLGGLDISSQPEEALIYLDAKYMGKTPKLLSNLKTGEHDVGLSRGGYYDYKRKVKISANKVLSLKATLNPIPSTLKISTNVVGAKVFLDSKFIGTTPLKTLKDIKPDEHALLFTKEGYHDKWHRMTTRPGGSTSTTVSMRPIKSIGIEPGEEVKSIGIKPTEEVKEKKPWYKRWWVWALIAGAVGGGTAVAVTTGS